jgi:Protein of unknown function (DUF3551)
MAGLASRRGKIYRPSVFMAVPAGLILRALEIAVKPLIAKLLFAAAVVTFLGCDVSAGHAAGWRHEPWCAFFEYDDVTVDCSYRTIEECTQNVIGGIRGTCGPNPDGPGVAAPTPAAAIHRHKKPHAQQ